MARALPDAPLSILQQVLLTTNGTVTEVLEAYAGEPILVVKLCQSFEQPTSRTRLEVDDQRLLTRTVTLQGARSGTTFLHADSHIAADRVPAGMLNALLETRRPLGRLLNEHRVESYWESVAAGVMAANSFGTYFGVAPESDLLYRTCLIHVGGRPLIRITEKFPATWFTERLVG